MGSQVSITTEGHSVTVNSDVNDLAYVVEKAQKLWEDTRADPSPAGPAVGFTSQIGPPPYVSGNKRWGGEIRPVRAEGE